MTRKRFVKLTRALTTTMRELGYETEPLELIVRRLHKGCIYTVDQSYQDAWAKWRKNALETYAEDNANKRLFAAIFYPIFFQEK